MDFIIVFGYVATCGFDLLLESVCVVLVDVSLISFVIVKHILYLFGGFYYYLGCMMHLDLVDWLGMGCYGSLLLTLICLFGLCVVLLVR